MSEARSASSEESLARALAAGTYRLRATGIGAIFEGDEFAHVVQRDLVVVEGETTEVVVQLEREALVEGTVLDAAGRPAAGVRVVALDANDEPHCVWTDFHTDGNGRFRLYAVPASARTLRVETHDGVVVTRPLSLQSGETTVLVPLLDLIDVEVEKQRLAKDLEKMQGELERAEGKLGNASFVEKAPSYVAPELAPAGRKGATPTRVKESPEGSVP